MYDPNQLFSDRVSAEYEQEQELAAKQGYQDGINGLPCRANVAGKPVYNISRTLYGQQWKLAKQQALRAEAAKEDEVQVNDDPRSFNTYNVYHQRKPVGRIYRNTVNERWSTSVDYRFYSTKQMAVDAVVEAAAKAKRVHDDSNWAVNKFNLGF